jgi:hypothetical protein
MIKLNLTIRKRVTHWQRVFYLWWSNRSDLEAIQVILGSEEE